MFQEATRSPSLPSASIVSRLFASWSQARRHGDALTLSDIHAHTSAKRWSSLARSGLVFLPRKYGSPSNARLPTYNAYKSPTPDSRFGLN
jgi:hypothetical protein